MGLFLGWTYEQWGLAADFLVARRLPLPAPDDAVGAASEVMAAWQECRLDEPTPPTLLLTDVLGREVRQDAPCNDARAWARRLWSNALRQVGPFCHPPHPNPF